MEMPLVLNSLVDPTVDWDEVVSLGIRNWRGGSLSAILCKLLLFIIFGCRGMLSVTEVLLNLKSRF
jgi:hypothetical protein